MQDNRLIVIGASARAGAFSASRAGYLPYWVDQFGDSDLSDRFAGIAVTPARYPQGIIDKIDQLPHVPWIYTGAMENHPDLLTRLAEKRELLGNGADICRLVRDPIRLARCLQKFNIKCPGLLLNLDSHQQGKHWLIKPIRSAGGLNIEFFNATSSFDFGRHYLQEFIEGDSYSAIFIGNGHESVLIGVTRQLVGETAFGARPFSYCGSIGPLPISSDDTWQWQRIGTALAGEFGLSGIFGVDAIRHDEEIIPVEVNPRYTASVEVIEIATGLPLIDLHCQACRGSLSEVHHQNISKVMGKAYLFAVADLLIPKGDLLTNSGETSLQLADVPWPGSRISAGAPVLTIITEGMDDINCYERLLQYGGMMLEKIISFDTKED